MDAVARMNELLKPYISDEVERMKIVCQLLTIILADMEESDGT